MGLDFSHGDAHFSYHGFNMFRERLATQIGIDLNSMLGYEDYGDPIGKSWEGIEDPIVLLLHHSDCEGELSPEACLKIAPRLRELLSSWEEGVGSTKRSGLKLAKAMEEAGEANEALEFF